MEQGQDHQIHVAIANALASTRHVREFHSADELPATLIAALCSMLPRLNPELWPKRLESGGVYLNGLRVGEDCPLPLPCRVEYFEPRCGSHDMQQLFAPFREDYIIYEDSDLLVVFKPPALPCLPTRDQQHWNLKAALTRYLGYAPHMPSRLDTSACGVVVTSKHPRSHKPVQHAFQFGAVRKEYIVEVSSSPHFDDLVVEQPIGRSPHHPILRMVSPQGLPSVTRFQRLGISAHGTMLLATPKTGRTHQIRVHAQHIGMPLVGDKFYGGIAAEELHLLSFRMTFYHPRLQRTIHVRVPERLLPSWVARVEFPLYNRASVSFT